MRQREPGRRAEQGTVGVDLVLGDGAVVDGGVPAEHQLRGAAVEHAQVGGRGRRHAVGERRARHAGRQGREVHLHVEGLHLDGRRDAGVQARDDGRGAERGRPAHAVDDDVVAGHALVVGRRAPRDREAARRRRGDLDVGRRRGALPVGVRRPVEEVGQPAGVAGRDLEEVAGDPDVGQAVPPRNSHTPSSFGVHVRERRRVDDAPAGSRPRRRPGTRRCGRSGWCRACSSSWGCRRSGHRRARRWCCRRRP